MNLLSKEKLLEMNIPACFTSSEITGEGRAARQHSVYTLTEDVRAVMTSEGVTPERLTHSICDELLCTPVPGYDLFGLEYDENTGVLKFSQQLSCD